ncbi:MAG: hypothetical protein U9N52_01715 [Campylobacterota bacterium]|nr:hypothetical protein [Campylobacterota bacterium]
MKTSLINKFISADRFSSYSDLNSYSQNMIYSKSSYIPLSVLEVALKNSIDELLTDIIGYSWFEDDSFLTNDSIRKVKDAKNILFRRGEKIIKSKIIAELSFGFWVNLFKKPYSKKLRTKELQRIFNNLPSKQDQIINREIIYKRLNHIRNFRNRVFHYEKVLDRDNYNLIHDEIYEILSFFDDEVCEFAKRANDE